MLYIIGLGLCDEKDITLKGLEAIKKSKKIYLEHYTSILIEYDKSKLVIKILNFNFERSEKLYQLKKLFDIYKKIFL